MVMRKYFLLLFVVCVFFCGCALHAPLSEGLMYIDKQVFEDNNNNTIKGMQLGLFCTASFFTEKFQQNAYKNYGIFEENKKLTPMWRCNLGNGESLIFNDNFALGFSIGLPYFDIGIDGTFRIIEKNYLTINSTPLTNNYELILQRKMFSHPNFGFSFGGYLRQERQSFSINDPLFILVMPLLGDAFRQMKKESFFTYSAGLRTTAQATYKDSYIRVYLHIGKELEFNTPVYVISVSFYSKELLELLASIPIPRRF